MKMSGAIGLAHQCGMLFGEAMRGDRAEILAVVGRQAADNGVHRPVRLVQDRVENRRQIARRSVDDLQHLSGRGLLFQRLPLPGQQPRVLDRNHRLVGERAHQLDLRVGVRFDPPPRQTYNPDRHAVAQQRHAEQRMDTAHPSVVLRLV